MSYKSKEKELLTWLKSKIETDNITQAQDRVEIFPNFSIR